MGLAPSAQGAPLPRCAGPVEIARAKVVRVERNGVLVLSDGRAVTLEGIRLQRAQPGVLEVQVAPRALAAIRDMTAAGDVTLTELRRILVDIGGGGQRFGTACHDVLHLRGSRGEGGRALGGVQ